MEPVPKAVHWCFPAYMDGSVNDQAKALIFPFFFFELGIIADRICLMDKVRVRRLPGFNQLLLDFSCFFFSHIA